MAQSNQDLLDRMLRHRIYLLGFGRYLADKVIALLESTAPALRRMLLDLFSIPSKRGLLGKLREAEAEVRRIRSEAWDAAFVLVVEELISMAEGEGKEFNEAARQPLAEPKKDRFPTLVAGALVAGQKLKEWFSSMSEADIRRTVAQIRISVLADEPLKKTLSRVTGKLSMVAAVANNGVKSLLATLVGSVSDSVRRTMLANNPREFHYEEWVSVLDSRTTPECRSLDGKIFPVGEGPSPGFHPWCRSMRVPFYEDGGSHQAESFAAWAETQSESFRKYAGNPFSAKDLGPLTLSEVHRLDQAA